MSRRKILVPIDINAQTDTALYFAKHIANKLNSMISCIYIMEDHGVLDSLLSSEEKHKLRRFAENKLSEKVNSVLMKEDKTPFELIISSGNVSQKILEKAVDLNAQLIVMGRSDSGQKRTKRVGSNTKRIVAKSPIPIVSVGNQTSNRRIHIILPLDLTKSFENQIRWAIDTASILEASVSVISVINQDQIGLRPVYLKKLNESCKEFTEKGIECTSRLLENKTTIANAILSFSNKTESGLILFMARQDKKMVKTDLGPIAAAVLANSEVPVQIINPACSSRYLKEDPIPIVTLKSPGWYPLEDQIIDNRQEI